MPGDVGVTVPPALALKAPAQMTFPAGEINAAISLAVLDDLVASGGCVLGRKAGVGLIDGRMASASTGRRVRCQQLY